MADLGTKCGLRRSPQCRLLLLFIIQCFLLPAICARCQGIEQLSLSIIPEGTIKVPYGKPLEIFCVVERYGAEDIEFKNGSANLPSDKVNSTTRRLYIERHDRGIFSYYCYNKIDRELCPTRVVVDSAPQNVTDFRCVSYNLDELNCTWTDKGISLTNYSIIISDDGRRTDPYPCKRKLGSRQFVCSWSTTGLPRYRQLIKTFDFTLMSSNGFGSNEQHFTVDHYSIVRPAPVVRLRVLEVGRYSVLLEWRLPLNMFDFLPNGVEHKIEYNVAKIDNTTFFRSVDTSSLPKRNETYKLLVPLPYAHMQYEVRVYIRPVEASGDEFWSHHSSIVFETAGKSAGEIKQMIALNWRRNMKKPGPSFRRKLWRMKAQKWLNRIWVETKRAASRLGFRLDAVDA